MILDDTPGQPCLSRERKTRFVEIFRTTPAETVCPNFYVLSHANGCLFQPHCSYCYLKSSFWYLDRQQVFTNVDKMVREIKAWIARDRLESYVLNTGNLSDSLVFEDVRPLVPQLVELFRREAEARGRKHTLLLVTKGGPRQCQCLLPLAPCRNVVISFSINNPRAAEEYERGAATVEDRLKCACQLKRHGWRIRIRIDPMILGFDYVGVAREVRRLAPERVTLGTLRSEAALPRFVDADLFSDLERPANHKGLARYPKRQRLALYRQVTEILSDTCLIGLCEETAEIWDELALDKDSWTCNCGV